MKSFFEEYGFVILAAIVVILLIAMCTPIGNLIKNQILGVVDAFAGKTETKLAALDADAAVKVSLRQLTDGKNDPNASTAGLFKVDVECDSATDKFTLDVRVKDQHGNWGSYTQVGADNLLATDSAKLNTKNFIVPIENGNQIQVRVHDLAKDASMYYESNIVTYTGGSATTAQAYSEATN